MFYARDMFLAKTLPADELMPVLNIPQMKKFNHLEVKEMLTTRWTHTAWYQSKVFGDNMLEIIEKPLSQVNWSAEPTLDHYYDLYKIGYQPHQSPPLLYDHERLVCLGRTRAPSQGT